MKRLVNTVVAAVMAATFTLVGGVRPAQAFDPNVIKQYIDMANSAVTLIKNVLGSGGSDAAIKSAVQQIIAAVESSKTQILSHVDALASAEAKACARHHLIEFADINQFSTDTMQSWAQDVTGCVTLIDSLLGAVTDKAQIDQLGLALDVAGPIALAARARAGFSVTALLTTMRHGNTLLVSALAPTCKAVTREGMIEYYNCIAYDGTKARDDDSLTAASNKATAGTSRAVAQAILPNLQP